jgi:hypothetical protein
MLALVIKMTKRNHHLLNFSSETKSKSEETQRPPKENQASSNFKLMLPSEREATGREVETRSGKISYNPIQS